ncbi:MAG: ABC transporter permease [Christensenellales bacterium]
MRAIWKRELQAYFLTPTGYVFMGVFLLLSSVMFYLQIMQARSSDLPTFVGQMSYLWMLLSPVLTMRLLAEERQRRTDQLLLTSPVSLSGMVLGKYAAAYTVMAATVVLTLGFVAVVAVYGRVYPAEMAVAYLGFILQGGAFLALDLFISGCAKKSGDGGGFLRSARTSSSGCWTCWKTPSTAASSPACCPSSAFISGLNHS